MSWFKVLDKDMCSLGIGGARKMQWEIGKRYHEGTSSLCVSGLHFVHDPMALMSEYPDSRVFLAQPGSIADEDGGKCVSCDGELVREVTAELRRALAEYEKVMQPALAEYMKVKQPASAEYEKVMQPALAEYEKVMQQVLASGNATVQGR